MTAGKVWSEHANSTSSYMEDLVLDGFYIKVYGDGQWYVFQDDYENCCKSWGRRKTLEEAKDCSIKVYYLLKQLKELEAYG